MKNSISVVIPFYNEEESLPLLYDRLNPVLSGIAVDYEIIFIDDGSSDGSLGFVRNLNLKDGRMKFISLSRNFGHQVASMAGIDHATKDAIVIMDADLQDPPELIPQLVAKWKEGFDIVYAKRKRREGEGLFKRLSAGIFYRLIKRLSRIDMPVDTGDFRLIDRKVAEDIKSMRIKNPYLRGMISWLGYKQTGVFFDREKRLKGKTKFSLTKMLKFAMDAVTLFSVTPLRLAVYLGFFIAFICSLYILDTIYQTVYLRITVPGWSSIMVAVLLLGSVQLISLGIIGEYIGRIYDEVRQRPLYFIKERGGIAQ
jgi:dolichol-phosphate mannosyltransferase